LQRTLVSEPFIIGAKNTPANTQLGNAVVGADASCSRFDFWAYPKGGAPFKALDKSLVKAKTVPSSNLRGPTDAVLSKGEPVA
jgi:hypothetical protein